MYYCICFSLVLLPEAVIKAAILANTCSFSTISGMHLKPDTLFLGNWQGSLTVRNQTLHILFHIKNSSNGYKASMDSPDQYAFGIPVSNVTITGNSLNLDIPRLNGTYEGHWNAHSQQIDGFWQQNGMTFKLDLHKIFKEENTTLNRPQEPKPPFPYDVRQIQFANHSSGDTLAGILTLPKGNGPFPGIILLSGSGPNDRNETVFGHKPFLVIADYLTRRGFAVLRYDKRGIGGSSGNYALATTKDFANDARAAVSYMQGLQVIAHKKIGLIGHSEGGLDALIAASDNTDVHFMILMATPAVKGDSLLYMQNRALLKVMNVPNIAIEQRIKHLHRIFEIIETTPDASDAASKLKTWLQKQNLPEKTIDAEIRQLLSPWMRYFISFNPETTFKHIGIPTLILCGSKDLQVPCLQNSRILYHGLTSSGNGAVTVKRFNGLNHLFQPATTGLPKEYAQIDTTISEPVLQSIDKWLNKVEQ